MYLFCIIPVPVFGCLYLLIEEDVDLMKVSENAFLLAEMGCYITKFLPLLRSSKEIKECILYFDAPQFRKINDTHRDILDDCIKICRRNTNIFLVSVAAGLVSWAVKPFFWSKYRLPVDVWIPFEIDFTPVIYYPLYVCIVLRE